MNDLQSDQLVRAIRMIGSQQHLARTLGINAKTFNHWLNREIRVPIQYALAIEVLTQGQVLADELAPHAKPQIENFRRYLLQKMP